MAKKQLKVKERGIKLLLSKIKGVILKVWKFLKVWGLQLINIVILMIAYGHLSNGPVFIDFIVGLWLFILLAYYIFWKLFKAEDLFKKE